MNTGALIATPVGPHHAVAAAEPVAARRLVLARRRRKTLLAPGPAPQAAVTLRLAAGRDIAAIERLAALDEVAVPGGALLVAEVDGRIRAVLPLAGGRPVADPFFPSAPLLPLLRARAAQFPARAAAPAPVAATPVCC